MDGIPEFAPVPLDRVDGCLACRGAGCGACRDLVVEAAVIDGRLHGVRVSTPIGHEPVATFTARGWDARGQTLAQQIAAKARTLLMPMQQRLGAANAWTATATQVGVPRAELKRLWTQVELWGRPPPQRGDYQTLKKTLDRNEPVGDVMTALEDWQAAGAGLPEAGRADRAFESMLTAAIRIADELFESLEPVHILALLRLFRAGRRMGSSLDYERSMQATARCIGRTVDAAIALPTGPALRLAPTPEEAFGALARGALATVQALEFYRDSRPERPLRWTAETAEPYFVRTAEEIDLVRLHLGRQLATCFRVRNNAEQLRDTLRAYAPQPPAPHPTLVQDARNAGEARVLVSLSRISSIVARFRQSAVDLEAQ